MRRNIHWLYGIVTTAAVVGAVLCESDLSAPLAVDGTALASATYLTALIWPSWGWWPRRGCWRRRAPKRSAR